MRSLLGVAAAAAVAIPASKVEAASALVDPDLPARDAVEVQARDLRPSDARPTERRGESRALPPGGAAPTRQRAVRPAPARPVRRQTNGGARNGLRMRY